MRKEEKTEIIHQLTETLNNNNKIYIADCSSLSVEKVNKLRKACFDKNVKMHVVKNTLLVKAIEAANDSRLAELIPAIKGATAIMLSDVGNAPAKIIKEFRGKGDRPILKGAFVEENVYLGDNQLETLANIKSKNELIGEVIGLLQSPISRVISALENSKKEETPAA